MQEHFNSNNDSDKTETPNGYKCTPDKELTPEQKSARNKHRVINICAIAFGLGLTFFAVLAFFISFIVDAVNGGSFGGLHAIVGSYVLAMLLAAPTIKVFLDKCTCKIIKKLNIASLIAIFVAIFIMLTVSLLLLIPGCPLVGRGWVY